MSLLPLSYSAHKRCSRLLKSRIQFLTRRGSSLPLLWRRRVVAASAASSPSTSMISHIDGLLWPIINHLFQIKIITRCQGLKEKHLQTPLKLKSSQSGARSTPPRSCWFCRLLRLWCRERSKPPAETNRLNPSHDITVGNLSGRTVHVTKTGFYIQYSYLISDMAQLHCPSSFDVC